MADSDAVRSARKRAHAAGDHSRCRAASCQVARRAVVRVVPAEVMPGLDPVAELHSLAVRLIEAHRADPLNMAVVKELRCTLLALPPREEDDPLVELQARVATKRAQHVAQRDEEE